MRRISSQRGSAIIMLFVAIALFGALAYAFTQNSRGSINMITNEQAKSYAQQIIAYGNDVKTAVKRLQLRGVKDTEISLSNSVFTKESGVVVANASPNCLSDACEVFKAAGGGLIPQISPKGSYLEVTRSANWTKPGHWNTKKFRVINVGTTEPELVFNLLDIKKEVCSAINNILAVDTSGEPPLEVNGSADWDGTYTTTSTDDIGDDAPIFQGKQAFCFKKIAGSVTFYQYSVVLIPR